MNLILARVTDCSADGCRVQSLTDDTVIDVPLAPRMRQLGIRIHPNMIVALDRGAAPSEIRWRFGGDIVESLTGDRATLRGQDFRLTDARPDEERRTPIHVGDTVLVRSGSATGELVVYDLMEGGRPLHPERLEADFPQIEAAYRDTATA